MSALSIPHARPPGTPTRSSAPFSPKEPRGVVRRYGGPPSALAATARATAIPSAQRRGAKTFGTDETVAGERRRVCPQFVRRRRIFVRRPSHICAHTLSGQLHDPGTDLVGLQPHSRQ